jgi:hypothetical protein
MEEGEVGEPAISKYGRMRSSILFEQQLESILTIQAHQDDTDIACGGTIAKLARMGKKVTYLLLTNGRHGLCDLDHCLMEGPAAKTSDLIRM